MGLGGGGKLSSTSPEGLGFVRSFNSCSQCVWEEIFIKVVSIVREDSLNRVVQKKKAILIATGGRKEMKGGGTKRERMFSFC